MLYSGNYHFSIENDKLVIKERGLYEFHYIVYILKFIYLIISSQVLKTPPVIGLILAYSTLSI